LSDVQCQLSVRRHGIMTVLSTYKLIQSASYYLQIETTSSFKELICLLKEKSLSL
jgi:hypothetical protein